MGGTNRRNDNNTRMGGRRKSRARLRASEKRISTWARVLESKQLFSPSPFDDAHQECSFRLAGRTKERAMVEMIDDRKETGRRDEEVEKMPY